MTGADQGRTGAGRQDRGSAGSPRDEGSGRAGAHAQDSEAALEAALLSLESSSRKHRAPDRFDARAFLLALGQCLLEERAVPADLLERLDRALGSELKERWMLTVREELTLAATEHIRAVDPRFLGRADYDFVYTIAARADLEARLRAAEELGLPASEDLLDRVARADELLQPFLEKRGR